LHARDEVTAPLPPPLPTAQAIKTGFNGIHRSTTSRTHASARANAGDRGAIVITGSFFLAGELRREWISEEDILAARSSFPRIAARVEAPSMIAEPTSLG